MMKTERILKISCMVLVVLCVFSTVYAEKKLYHGYGEYTMSEYETPQIAEQRALLYARRNILEQAGVYVKTYTRMQNMQITDDQVYMVTSSLLNITHKDTRKKTSGGGLHIEANMTAEVDMDGIKDMLQNRGDKSGEISFNSLHNEMNRIDNEYNELKKKIAQEMDENKRAEQLKIRAKIKEYEFAANEKLEECLVEYKKKNYSRCKQLAEEVIKFNPKNYLGYYELGKAYCALDGYDVAIKKYNQALVLNKQDSRVYNRLGLAYRLKNDISRAILNYTIAIKINSDLDAYYNRAKAYYDMGQYEKALNDVEKGLEIVPHDLDFEVLMTKLIRKV